MFTLIDDGNPHEIDATIENGHVWLSPEALGSLGWELHPEGLCREGLCIPVPDASALDVGGRIDLGAVARLIDRPLTVDAEERAAYLGVSAGDRARALHWLAWCDAVCAACFP